MMTSKVPSYKYPGMARSRIAEEVGRATLLRPDGVVPRSREHLCSPHIIAFSILAF